MSRPNKEIPMNTSCVFANVDCLIPAQENRVVASRQVFYPNTNQLQPTFLCGVFPLIVMLLFTTVPVYSQVERLQSVSKAPAFIPSGEREHLDRVFNKYQLIDIDLPRA